MMRIAVAFHDQPAIDEQIDSPHSRYAHLQFDSLRDAAQKEPHERLRPGLGPSVDQAPERTVPER